MAQERRESDNFSQLASEVDTEFTPANGDSTKSPIGPSKFAKPKKGVSTPSEKSSVSPLDAFSSAGTQNNSPVVI